MKHITTYLGTLLFSIALSIFVASLFVPKNDIPKFSAHELSLFNKTFISSYGDQDAVHRIVYHGLFHFGDRMRNADVLIVGTSHAEAGLSAEQLGNALTLQAGRPIKVMNLGLGWTEPFSFQQQALKHNNVRCKIVLLELFDSVSDNLSVIGKPVIAESRLTSYSKVYETWAITAKDWLLDSHLPRISFLHNKFSIERFLKYPVGFREWDNGDVWDYWLPLQGEVYRNTPSTLATHPDEIRFKNTGDMQHAKQILDVENMRANGLQIVTTLVPSNIEPHSFVDPIKALGIPFINIPFAGIELYDHNHVDSFGRSQATNLFINNWRSNVLLPMARALQYKEICDGS